MYFDRRVRAVLLDVDGTLYQQTALRVFMILELLALPFIRRSYRASADVWKALSMFRRIREELRGCNSASKSLSDLQYFVTARRLNRDPNLIAELVEEWIYQRPLKYLRSCRREGVRSFCEFLQEQNILLGVFSDYPANEKLRALQLSNYKISPVLCATDNEINAFKPHPNGFLRACEIWGVAPDEVLYVGDRFEVDAAGAAAAGMPCAIINNRRKKDHPGLANCFVISSFSELQHVLLNSNRR
jgi:HAD superfamily hydrolase (TIGR01549 family)